MLVCIEKLENGLGITIPSDVLQQLRMRNGSPVELTIEGDHISITPKEAAIPYTVEFLKTNYKKQILEIAAANKARNIRIFGSVARGESRLDSDIDFLVTMEPGSGLEICKLQCDLQDLLNCRIDVVEEICLNPMIRDQVLKEAIEL